MLPRLPQSRLPNSNDMRQHQPDYLAVATRNRAFVIWAFLNVLGCGNSRQSGAPLPVSIHHARISVPTTTLGSARTS
jgi:hypothetical protein